MRAGPRAMTLAALLLAASTASLAGAWSFGPNVSLQQRYQSNVRLTSAGKGDFITRLGTDFPAQWAGSRNTVALSVGAAYDHYLENTELDNWSQSVRTGWSLAARRARWNAGLSWTRTANPLLSAIGQDGSVTSPGFLVERNTTDFWVATAGMTRDVTGTATLGLLLDATATDFERPDLIDNSTARAVLEARVTESERFAWNVGYRYQRFHGSTSSRLPVADGEIQAVVASTSGFGAVQAGTDHRLTRRLSWNWQVGVILNQVGAFKSQGAGRFYGSTVLSGERRRFRWGLGYSLDFSSGGGVRVVVRNESYNLDLGWNVGRKGSVGLSVSQARSEGLDLDIRNERLQLRYSQPVSQSWSAEAVVAVVDQGNAGGRFAGSVDGVVIPERPAGTFRDELVSIMFRYSRQRRS